MKREGHRPGLGRSWAALARGTQHGAHAAPFGKGFASGSAALRRPCLHGSFRVGRSVGSLASPPMAAPQGPLCEIRFVVEHHYPEGVKGGAHPCEVRFFGKRGKPVKKMRLVPAEKAHEIARRLQGAKGSSISVI